MRDYFKEHNDFWEDGKYVKYFEHKTDSYKNNKRKIYTYNKGFLFMEEPCKDKGTNGTSYGFTMGNGKLVDEESLNKYYNEISKTTFFEKQITNIVTK